MNSSAFYCKPKKNEVIKMAVKKTMLKAKTEKIAVPKAKPAKTAKTAKPVKAAKAAKTAPTAEENLKKLAKSNLPADFVKKHEGSWNHQEWLAFLEEIKASGYDPINTDYVGLILEEKKAAFLAGK